MSNVAALYLDRLAFGPRPGEIDALDRTGWVSWLETQLNPPPGEDPWAREALLNATLPIAYTDTDGTQVNERRPLRLLGLSQEALWPLQNAKLTPVAALRTRPALEVQTASIVRAVAAGYQLREVLVQFWHNHFNVYPEGSEQIGVAFPVYDREVIRPHALGNFGQLLLATSRATSMLYYLNQEASTKKAPNENYARELLELHTLGVDAYRGRGTTTSATPDSTSYTDQDVREVARALTGWTTANGTRVDENSTRPNHGGFIFSQSLHDDAIKRPFGIALGQGTTWRGRTEGETIMTVLAASPATARHLATKLCRQLVADDPPAGLVNRISAIWLATVQAPDQIAQVVRAIAVSPEFGASLGAKLKNPFRLMIGYMRGTQMPWTPSNVLTGRLSGMGFKLHSWPTPNGMPDVASAWSSVSGVTQRWNTLAMLFHPSWGVATGTFAERTPTGFTQGRQIVDYWGQVLLQGRLGAESRAALVAYAESSGMFGNPFLWGHASGYENALHGIVSAIASTPEYQYG